MKQLVEFDITEAAIAKMENLYMGLTVKGVDDDKGFQEVHEARMVVKNHRVSVEKRRKELKADALEWGRRVDTEAKKIFSKLEPIENHLAEQERIVTDEKKRIKEAEERAFQEKIDNRMQQLSEYGRSTAFQKVATMPDDEWEQCIFNIIQEFNAEQKRIEEERRIEAERQAKIEAEQKAEAERLEKIRKEQEQQAAKIKAEQDRINAELAKKQAEIRAKEEAIRKEQERIERIEFEKKAKEEARIKAEKEAKERAEREAREAEERKAAEEAEKARIEALKPDREKAIKYFSRVSNFVSEIPNLENEELRNVLYGFIGSVLTLIDDLVDDVKEMK